jgi:2-keto-4-pentenoate hydratase/2-oxohepta-3-ene-1,7-dioic acid hydratase in catechol pathway
MVRGSELFAALAACDAEGLGLRLDVDEGDGFVRRQEATTAAMIVSPLDLLATIAEQIAASGLRTPMPVERAGVVRYYPFAVQSEQGATLRLPAGSIVLTGTPEGVAMQAPSIPGVVARGLLHLRGPIEQFRREELARAAEGAPGGYLAPGDRVRASVDGLGTQIIRIAESGSPIPRDACE